MSTTKIAYLISQYPAISHTFILREIRRLRILGIDISTASINIPNRLLTDMDEEEKEECQNTFYIKEQGGVKATYILFKRLFINPLRTLNGIKSAFNLFGNGFKGRIKNLGYLAEALILGDWATNENISHLHVHFANPAASVAMLASELYPLTFSMTVHGPDEFYNVTLNNLPKKIEKSAFVIAISDYTQSQLMRISPPSEWYKFTVIRLGVDCDVFAPIFDPIKNPPCRLLCVGRLVPNKGQFILIAAIHELVKQGKNLHLCLVGDGSDRGALEKEVQLRGLQKKVNFTGAMNSNQVLSMYANTDIFVLPSFAEGLPVVLMEAMAMEIPCVTTEINGIPELIRHNVEGLLVPPSNCEQLTQALELLIDDADLRKKFGRASRLQVLERYNLEDNIRKLYYFFRGVL